MKNKIKLIVLILSLILVLSLFAQDTASQNNENSNNRQVNNSKFDVMLKPVHHCYVPRRKTVISMEKYQETIDLDKKIRESNKLLYKDMK